MSPKEYLSQIRDCEITINNKLAQIEKLRALAESVTSTLKDDVVQRSGTSDKVGDCACRIADLQKEVSSDIDKLIDLEREIVGVIQKIEGQYGDLLYKRYVLFQKWEKIALEMGITYRHAVRMHGIALKKVSDVLECHTKSVI